MACLKLSLSALVLVSSFLPLETRGEENAPRALERYVFDLGSSGGFDLSFLDPRLGNGDAFFRLELRSRNPRVADVRLEIGRHVHPDTITFALLVSRIRMSFHDRAGRIIQEVDVSGESLWPGGFFIIGDSAHGYFQQSETIRGLARARRVVVRIFGNYE